MTDTSENITSPQTACVGGNDTFSSSIIYWNLQLNRVKFREYDAREYPSESDQYTISFIELYSNGASDCSLAAEIEIEYFSRKCDEYTDAWQGLVRENVSFVCTS